MWKREEATKDINWVSIVVFDDPKFLQFLCRVRRVLSWGGGGQVWPPGYAQCPEICFLGNFFYLSLFHYFYQFSKLILD
jgi:hypothetical protein